MCGHFVSLGVIEKELYTSNICLYSITKKIEFFYYKHLIIFITYYTHRHRTLDTHVILSTR